MTGKRLFACMVCYAVLGFLATALVQAQNLAEDSTRGLKVYISADMEGTSAVASRSESSSSGINYERFRRIMTADVNAAIDAAIAAGATEIVVSDSHGGADNLLVNELNPIARVVRSQPRPLDMMQGIDESFDAVLLIGYHASALVPDALQAHTMTGAIHSISLNGQVVPEGGVSAAVAGAYGVPVALISGDRAAVEELRAILGDVEGAEVKVAHGVYSATTLHPDIAHKLIYDRTLAALQRLDDFKPYVPESPIRVEMAFKRLVDAELVSFFPGAERVDAITVAIELPDMLDAAGFINVATFVRGPGD